VFRAPDKEKELDRSWYERGRSLKKVMVGRTEAKRPRGSSRIGTIGDLIENSYIQ